MPRQTEPSVNNALGGLLQGMLPRSHVQSESTQTISGYAGRRPDILMTAPGRSPVVVEAEYLPAVTAEAEAKSRLGLELAANGRIIEAAIALRYADAIGEAHDLPAALSSARLDYCVFTESAKGVQRFPESGWLEGAVEDLADMVRLVSVPQRAVDQAADTLQEGIEGAAKLLDELNETRSGITTSIARRLGMIDVPQTRRMACAIIANALVFHEHIAGMHPDVKPLAKVCGVGVDNPQGEVLAAWVDILKINYWAIFAIAKDVLEQLPSGDAADILRRLRNTAQSVNATGVVHAHDLTGRIFQRLIADRKYLATFYTLPASAALLARLAVAKMDGVDWGNAEAIGKLRIADFACGTGALLSAVYEQVAARHERAGGDPATLHRLMMEKVLYGCDVMPSAVHITSSTLSGVEPSVLFNKSRLYTMPYGRMKDGSVMIGSLELLQSSTALTLFNTSDPALRTGSAGEETATQILAEFPDESYDLVIMNPPFTSNSTNERMHVGTFAPAFAAFNASSQDQMDMVKRMSSLKKDTCYHGHAGLASGFAALGHRKLKPGGVLALVLPLTSSAASSWQGFREMMATQYTDLTVLSIAANGNDMSFSSDTGMAECLVIARKKLKCGDKGDLPEMARFTSLHRRPQGIAHAAVVAGRITTAGYIRHIQDGPYGGTTLWLGDQSIGETLTIPQADSATWGSVRILDNSLAQTAYALAQSRLWLPGFHDAFQLIAVPLGEIESLGLYNLDIIGKPPQGPFDKLPPNSTATYPALWNHDATKETHLVCQPDSQLQVRPGMEVKSATVWAHAGRAHINQEFTFGSQALAAAFTEYTTMGGRVWPNVHFEDRRFDCLFTLWSNSTLGLITHWWHSSRQQSSKATIAVRNPESTEGRPWGQSLKKPAGAPLNLG